MTVHEIVKHWLTGAGYDGLVSSDGECACELSDLFPCCTEDNSDCEAGHKVSCEPRECHVGGECDWHIRPGAKGGVLR